MGKRGPKKIPTAELKRRDSWRAKDREGAEAIAGEALDTARVPDHFDENARRLWNEIGELLAESSVAKETDRLALELFCDVYAQYCIERQEVRENGSVQMGAESMTVSPHMRNFTAMHDRIMKLCKTFGLTPADRPDVFGNSGSDGEEDPAEEFFT